MSEFTPYAKYMEDSDILYVRLREGPITRTRGLDLWRNLDLDAAGRAVAVEFVNATDNLILDDVPERETIERLIREAGIPVPLVRRPA